MYRPEDVIIKRLEDRLTKESVSDGRKEIYEKQKKDFEDIGADFELVTTNEVSNNIQVIMDKIKNTR